MARRLAALEKTASEGSRASSQALSRGSNQNPGQGSGGVVLPPEVLPSTALSPIRKVPEAPTPERQEGAKQHRLEQEMRGGTICSLQRKRDQQNHHWSPLQCRCLHSRQKELPLQIHHNSHQCFPRFQAKHKMEELNRRGDQRKSSLVYHRHTHH